MVRPTENGYAGFTCSEYTTWLKERVEAFSQYWAKGELGQSECTSEPFPATMEHAEWHEQFISWLEMNTTDISIG